MNTLEIKEITKAYKGKKAVDNISFKINAGHIIGLLGPNGAGKTTTMNIITGISASDTGQVLFDGQEMTQENDIGIKQKIGFLSESNPLYNDMLVGEYLSFAAAVRGMNKEQSKKAIREVIKKTGLEEKMNQPIEELSKGYKQRVGLAQAILHEPEILILDEPTEGLDPNQRVIIRDLIAKLGEKRTVMISTHVLSEVQAVCDQVLILNEGKLVSQGSVDEIMKQGQEGQKVTVEMKGGEDSRQVFESDERMNLIDEKNIEDRKLYTVISSGESDIRPLIFNLAKQNNWILYDLHQESTSLEDIFRNLTTSK